MSISPNELYLWSRSNGEISLVRTLRPASSGWAVELCNRHGTPVVGGGTMLAGLKQLTRAVKLGEVGEREFKALQAARVNVLIFDNVTEGKLICGQIVSASMPWVNVRYKSSVMNRQSHNVYLMPKQALPEFKIDPVAAAFEELKQTKPVETTDATAALVAAGAERGFILWNPKSTYAPTVVYPTLDEALKVQRHMAAKCRGEAFHICPVGPGLVIETVTTTTEKFV